jgi:hypothetical protein
MLIIRDPELLRRPMKLDTLLYLRIEIADALDISRKE